MRLYIYIQECIRGSTELLYTQYKSRCDVDTSQTLTIYPIDVDID